MESRNLLSISDMSPADIETIFRMSRNRRTGDEELLKGKTFVLFFPESSIRTRISFELAVRELGARGILFPPAALDKRETHKDVAAYIENWADGIIIRHSEMEVIQAMAAGCRIPVINGMCRENHPCEIISDLFTLSEMRRDYLKLNYLFVGREGNIYNSWERASKLLGFRLRRVGPPDILETALPDSDVILTDSLAESDRNEAYYSEYRIDLARMKKTRPGSILLPCPPFYRGEEVGEDAIDSSYFGGYGFKKNLLPVQKAIILFCLGFRE